MPSTRNIEMSRILSLVLFTFSFFLLFSFVSALPIVASVVVGDDAPVQEFRPTNFIPVQADVRSGKELVSASYCVCSLDVENGCKSNEVELCGAMTLQRKAGDVHRFSALIPPLTQEGTYKVRIFASDSTGGSQRYWYPSHESSSSKGVVKVSNALVFSSASRRKVIHTPAPFKVVYDSSALEELPSIPVKVQQLRSRLSRLDSCFEFRSVENVRPIVGNPDYVEDQLEITYNPLCQVCGSFRLPMQTIGRGIERQEIAINVPCTADVLIVTNGEMLREPYIVTEKRNVGGKWVEVSKPPKSDSSDDFVAYYQNVVAYADKLAKRRISVRYVELDREIHLRAGYLLSSFSGQPREECRADYIDLPPKAAKVSATRYGLTKPECVDVHVPFVDAVKRLRSKVKPKYLILTGHHRLLPSALLSCTDGDYSACVFSDDVYGSSIRSTTSVSFKGLPELPISRVPGFNAKQLAAMFRTMASRTSVEDEPRLLMLPVDEASGHSAATIEKHRNLFNKGNTIARNLFGYVCREPGCVFAPDVCLPWRGSVPLKRDCSAPRARNLFTTANILVFQGHSFRQGWLGDHTWPEKRTCMEQTGREHGCDYFSIVTARDPRDPNNPPTLPDRTPVFFINNACNSVNTVGERRADDQDTPGNQPLMASAMLMRSTSAGIGFTGKSHTVIILPEDVFNKGITAGDLLMRIKRRMASKDPEQMSKIGLVGDPLLVVKMKKV